MEYYKKYRIIENISLTKSINKLIDFFHKIPLIGKHMSDKYRLYGFKRFVHLLGPIFSLLGQAIKCLAAFSISLSISGAIIWLINKLGIYQSHHYKDFMDYGANNLAFLSFYLTPALISNYIEGGKFRIHELNKLYRIRAKEVALIFGAFDPLRIAIGRILGFWILFGFSKAFFMSFTLAFVRIGANTINLHKASKKEKRLTDKFAFIIILEIVLFAILIKVKTISFAFLLPLFVISFLVFIFSIRYLLKYDSYDKLLEVAKKESANIDLDYDTIANDSLALKDDDLVMSDKPRGSGYDLLNALFFQRHRRLLVKPIIKKDLIILLAIFAILLFSKFIFKGLASKVDGLFITALPIIAMLIFNDNESNRAFFLNCDRPLMQYGFYRQEKSIFYMYKLRYKSLLKINLIGLLVGLISLILYIFLYKSMGLDTSLLAGGIILGSYFFYPAFNLTNYYIFQPFNYDASAKGGLYKFATSLIGYINILIIPMIVGNIKGKSSQILIILIVLIAIMLIIFPYIVKKYGKETFRIRK